MYLKKLPFLSFLLSTLKEFTIQYVQSQDIDNFKLRYDWIVLKLSDMLSDTNLVYEKNSTIYKDLANLLWKLERFKADLTEITSASSANKSHWNQQLILMLKGLSNRFPNEFESLPGILLLGDNIKSVIEQKIRSYKRVSIQIITLIVFVGIVIGIGTYVGNFQNPSNHSGPKIMIPEGASIMGNPGYKPDNLHILNGETIIVQNTDTRIHTITSGKSIDESTKGKLFDTGIINPGMSAEIVIANLIPGNYSFHCKIFPNMTGNIQVIDRKITIT